MCADVYYRVLSVGKKKGVRLWKKRRNSDVCSFNKHDLHSRIILGYLGYYLHHTCFHTMIKLNSVVITLVQSFPSAPSMSKICFKSQGSAFIIPPRLSSLRRTPHHISTCSPSPRQPQLSFSCPALLSTTDETLLCCPACSLIL